MPKGRKQEVSERWGFFLKFRSIIRIKKYTMDMMHAGQAVMQ